jgi:hypothetical protein
VSNLDVDVRFKADQHLREVRVPIRGGDVQSGALVVVATVAERDALEIVRVSELPVPIQEYARRRHVVVGRVVEELGKVFGDGADRVLVVLLFVKRLRSGRQEKRQAGWGAGRQEEREGGLVREGQCRGSDLHKHEFLLLLA